MTFVIEPNLSRLGDRLKNKNHCSNLLLLTIQKTTIQTWIIYILLQDMDELL